SVTVAIPWTCTYAYGGRSMSTQTTRRGSRAIARAFAVVPPVLNHSSSPSTTNQTGATSGRPSAATKPSFAVRVPWLRNSRISGVSTGEAYGRGRGWPEHEHSGRIADPGAARGGGARPLDLRARHQRVHDHGPAAGDGAGPRGQHPADGLPHLGVRDRHDRRRTADGRGDARDAAPHHARRLVGGVRGGSRAGRAGVGLRGGAGRARADGPGDGDVLGGGGGRRRVDGGRAPAGARTGRAAVRADDRDGAGDPAGHGRRAAA